MHQQRKEFNLEEDPWDNYLFFDSKKLAALICHGSPLTLPEQVILAKFLEHSVLTETISQYKMTGKELIRELMAFATGFGGSPTQDEDIVHDDEKSVSTSGLITKI